MKLARETPLEFAISICRFGIAELLIAKGAKTNCITLLDLGLQQLSTVPNFISKLTNLKQLRCNDKILASVPASVKKKGEKEILHYFQDLAADELVPYRSVKVMVLGKEGVGKVINLFAQLMRFFKNSFSDAFVASVARKELHKKHFYRRNRCLFVSPQFNGFDLVRFRRPRGEKKNQKKIKKILIIFSDRCTIRLTVFF